MCFIERKSTKMKGNKEDGAFQWKKPVEASRTILKMDKDKGRKATPQTLIFERMKETVAIDPYYCVIC